MEDRYYSQNGEDKVFDHIFDTIDLTKGYAVELGADDGYKFSNIRRFLDKGWEGIQITKNVDTRTPIPKELKDEFITAENINELLDKYNVPKEVDLLSLDIDGNDYWVFKNLNRRAKVVCVEYNPGFPLGVKKALKYDPNLQRPDGTMAFGASFTAWIDLLKEKGYVPIYELSHCNIIAVDEKIKQGRIFYSFSFAPYVEEIKAPWIPHNNLDPEPPGTEWVDV
jgi:hypothetical protein